MKQFNQINPIYHQSIQTQFVPQIPFSNIKQVNQPNLQANQLVQKAYS
jgi:hypothetical protein